MSPLFTLRWSGRDLRRRWVQVTAIALIIAIGSGVYSALGSTAIWRRQSNDASFEQTAMYDLRVRSTEGVDAPQGGMLAVLAQLDDPSVVSSAEERLVLPTQVDASTEADTILVPGRLVGMTMTEAGSTVNRVFVADGDGRTVTEADRGDPVAVLERNFAEFYGLPPTGEVVVAGGTTVRYVGLGLAPEYFFVITEDGGFFAQANLAVLFVPLETAQSLTGRAGRVNDLVIRLRPGADAVALGTELERLFQASGLGLGVTVMQTEDEDAYRVLYDDIEGDQQFWNVFAALILAGATFGAFNLASRMVEAQRREIGIGMALGQSPGELAVRPLLVGVEIALAGAVLGVVVGSLVIRALRPVYRSVLPLPVWETAFQPQLFVRGAALGFALPLLATAWPVWRAVRVTPVEAITTTHRTARGGLAPLLRHLRWPVSAFRRMPLGNVLRTPRRSLLTALGIGAAISTLVAVLGMLDSFIGTMDRNDREVLGDHPDRVAVTLERMVTLDGPELQAISRADAVGEIAASVRLGATVSAAGAETLEVILEVLDLDGDVWAPTILRGDGRRRDGLMLAEKAAADLGVAPGDTVTLTHPVLRDGRVTLEPTEVPVAAIHPSPFRFAAYLDRSQLGLLGMTGLANQLSVLPEPGRDPDDLKRSLFDLDAVASVQPVAVANQVVKDSLDDFTSIFRVLQAFIVFLVLLIAYNATSINADERARERATLFAFGLPVRRVIGLETAEGLLSGVVGTAVGLGIGLLVVQWVTTTVAGSTMPDISLEVIVSLESLLTTVVLGVGAVAIAPLLTLRRLLRMDIPGTLRVVE